MGERDTKSPAENRWRAHPVQSALIRGAVFLVPFLAGVAVVAALARMIPRPPGLAVVWWFGFLLIASTLAATSVERLARRFLPLAVLLELSLVFPDRAPSRYRLARSAGNVRQLSDRVQAAKEHGAADDATSAAETILSLVAALSAHDRKTRGHSERVRVYTDLLAESLGIPADERDRLRWGSLLHDIGKLHVSAGILNKAGKPTEQEWEALKRHPEEGARLAQPLLEWLGPWGETIVDHHERYDGNGYPSGKGGDEISLGGRIVAVADSFEVMTAARSYKRPMSVAAARRELADCAGGQFDPAMVRAFLNVSLGRLRWAVGPASWVAQLPFVGGLQRAGTELVVAAKSATVVAAVGVAGAVNAGLARAATPSADRGPAAVQPENAPEVSPSPDGVGEADGDRSGETGGTRDGGKDGTKDGGSGDGGSGGEDPTREPSPSPTRTTDPSPDPIREVTDPVDDVVDDTTDAVKEATRPVEDTVKSVGSSLPSPTALLP